MNRTRCNSDLLDEFHIDEYLNFIEEPIEIMDREVKRLKQSRILIMKVRWNLEDGPELLLGTRRTKCKEYPNMFANPIESLMRVATIEIRLN
ncbi:hypothetical protein Tco_0824010 [Tanacetum coccineum]|uniref:Reverse transcriptase domain-containing protein n=1 Tax=Tanacetum coccineum TaxID=301880 RepID=A0ABQ5AJI8_9ASTR